MLPLLYESDSPVPSSGSMSFLGRLVKCERCSVAEQKNGDYNLSAVFSPTDELITEVINQRFLSAKPNPFDPPQFFELYDCNFDKANRLTVKGRHIKHCGYNNVVCDITSGEYAPPETTPTVHWNNISELCVFNNNYTFYSDITDTAALEIGYTKSGTLGAFLEEMSNVFGGEYYYNNFSVSLLEHRGEKKNYTLRWDRNIESPSLTLSTANLYSHVVATADVTILRGNTGDSFKAQVYSAPHAIRSHTSRLTRIFLFDANSQISKKEIQWYSDSDRETLGFELERAASKFARLDYKNQIQYTENVNLKITYRPLLDEMQEVGLCDIIDVGLKGGRTVEAQITKTEFDCLAERWSSVELGEEKLKISNYILKKR